MHKFLISPLNRKWSHYIKYEYNNMESQQKQKSSELKAKGANKTLMRLQRPIYRIKKKQESSAEYMIRTLMEKRDEKPKIQAVQRSPLLSQLQSLMPKFKKANQQLSLKPVQESEKIDAKLEQVQDSSSSSDQDNQHQHGNQGTKPIENKQMIDQSEEGVECSQTNQIQMNFLRYQLPQKLHPTEVREFDMKLTKDQQINDKTVKKLIVELQ